MKQKLQFNGFFGLKMFSNIIYYLFKKNYSFWYFEKKRSLAVFSYQDENRTK
jgi:hypothetical protein